MAKAVRMMRSWREIYRVPGLDTELMREVGRAVVRALLTLAFAYCALVGWDVVQRLREVKLSELRDVLHLVSVGDALLLWVGCSLAREIIRSLARPPPRGLVDAFRTPARSDGVPDDGDGDRQQRDPC